jgi:hypothetical protein
VKGERAYDPGIIALVALMVLLISVTAYAIKKAQDSAAESHRTLCSLLDGYQKQYTATQKYIDKHPQGISALGLSKAELDRGQVILKRRIDSFEDSNC